LLGAQTWFTIETQHGDSADVKVTVLTPNNEELNPSTRLTSDGLRVDWVPSEVGTYTVHVTFAGNPVPGSPFRVKCYDPKNVIVTPPTSDGAVRKPTRFLGKFIDTINFEILFIQLHKLRQALDGFST